MLNLTLCICLNSTAIIPSPYNIRLILALVSPWYYCAWGLERQTLCFFFLTFYFEINLNLQSSCKDKKENSNTTPHLLPPKLTSHKDTVKLQEINLGTIPLTKTTHIFMLDFNSLSSISFSVPGPDAFCCTVSLA